MELGRSYTLDEALAFQRDLFAETLTRTAKICGRQGIFLTPDQVLTVHLTFKREVDRAYHMGVYDRRKRRRGEA